MESVGNWPLVDFDQEIVCEAEGIRESEGRLLLLAWGSERYSSILAARGKLGKKEEGRRWNEDKHFSFIYVLILFCNLPLAYFNPSNNLSSHIKVNKVNLIDLIDLNLIELRTIAVPSLANLAIFLAHPCNIHE